MNNQLTVCCATLLAFSAIRAQEARTDSMALQELDEVVVSDSRFELSRENSGKTVIRIGPRELARNQGRTVAELLNTKSGIEISGSRGRQGEVLGVYARGGRGRQVLVLIDGVRVIDPSSSSQEYDLRLLSLDAVESIEIIKGASSTLYGANAATAVLNITTKKVTGRKLRLSVESSMGTNQAAGDSDYSIAAFSNSARLGGTLGALDYTAAISQAYTGNLSSLVTTEGEEDPFSRYNADFRLGYKFSKGPYLRLYGNKSHFRSAYDEAFGLMDAPYEYTSEQNRAGMAITAGYDKGEVNINAAFSEFSSDNISNFPGSFDGRNQVVEAYNKYIFNETLYSLVGLSYIKDRATFGEPRDFTILDPYLNLVYVSAYGLNINVGTRLNTHSEYGNQWVYNFNPSFSFLLENGYLKMMGTLATSYITPSLTQLFGEFGANPRLEPETNRTIESGLEWVKDSSLRASILYFNRREDNYVFFDSAEFLYRNSSGTIRARGVEAEVRWIPFPKARFDANYTFTERKGDNAIRIPKHKIHAEFGLDLAKGTYGALQYAYTGSRVDTDFVTFTDTDLEPFSLVHLYFSQELMAGRMKVFLSAENIFNTDYTEILGFSTRGRNLRAGFALTL